MDSFFLCLPLFSFLLFCHLLCLSHTLSLSLSHAFPFSCTLLFLFLTSISLYHHFFLNGPIPASFYLFLFFFITISIIQIEKSIDGIRTQGCRMVGADKTTELWRPPCLRSLLLVHFLIFETHIFSWQSLTVSSYPKLLSLNFTIVRLT